MSKWDNRFLAMAKLVASWSKDPSTQVGAVIVDEKQRVRSLGFNGQPRGCADLTEISREEKLLRTIHAEHNAVLFAGRAGGTEGCTIYVSAPPCARCAAFITQAGIRTVIHHPADPEFAVRWQDDMREAARIFGEASVTVIEISNEDQ